MKAKADATYNGYSIKGDYTVELKFRIISGIYEGLSFIPLIGAPLMLGYSINDSKQKTKLGKVVIYSCRIDRDGQMNLTFRSQTDSIQIEKVSPLLQQEAIITLFGIGE